MRVLMQYGRYVRHTTPNMTRLKCFSRPSDNCKAFQRLTGVTAGVGGGVVVGCRMRRQCKPALGSSYRAWMMGMRSEHAHRKCSSPASWLTGDAAGWLLVAVVVAGLARWAADLLQVGLCRVCCGEDRACIHRVSNFSVHWGILVVYCMSDMPSSTKHVPQHQY